MNRREMLKRSLGVGAMAASVPLVQKLGASGLSGSDVGPTPPVPYDDIRTPEQVYEDELTAQVARWVERIENPPARLYGKYSDSMSWCVFNRLVAKGISLPLHRFGDPTWVSRPGVVINGCPVLLY